MMIKLSAAVVLLGAAIFTVFQPVGSAALIWLTPENLVDLAVKKDSVSHSGFAWIPHTHVIVYSRVADVSQGSWVYEIQVPSGKTAKITPGEDPVPSPNGREIAFLRPGVESFTQRGLPGTSSLQVWVSAIDGTGARQLTHAAQGICDFASNLSWSPDSQPLLYLTCAVDDRQKHVAASANAPSVEVFPLQQSVSEFYVLHAVDVHSGIDTVIIQHRGEFGRQASWLNSDTILYETDNGKPPRAVRSELATISRTTGHRNVVLSGYQWQVFYEPALNAQRTRVAFRGDPAESTWYPFRMEVGILDLKSRVVRLLSFSKNAVFAPHAQMAWTPDGKWLLYSDGPSTRFQLVATDGASISRNVTFGDGKNYSALFSDDGKYVAWSHEDNVASLSLQVGRWIAGRIASGRTLAVLTAPLTGIASGRTKVVRWRSFDGTTIDGYLTLPLNRTGARYQTVVLVHGGPAFSNSIDEDEWPGGIYFIEYLAQHGYAVFQPDYRASGNFGYDLMLQERTKQDVYKEDFGDISSGIEALERNGIIDPSRLYLIGHSNGSFEANWIITHDSRFRAAISYEGGDEFYDWSREDGPNAATEWLLKSTPLTQPAVWQANSAVLNAGNARTPTLFINAENGINSPSMPWLAGALQSKGIDSQYILYRGEPHVIVQPANQRDLLRRILAWLRSH